MITWLTASQLFWVFMLCQARNNIGMNPTLFEVSRLLAVTFTAVPAIYTVGWLLLPAWGLSAIPLGGR